MAWAEGHRLVAGVDEVGRGALAGPVVVAAVILDPQCVPEGIDDSKRLSEKRRETLAAAVIESALACTVARVEAAEIDRINILRATLTAMRAAIDLLDPKPDCIFIDGNVRLPNFPGVQRTVVGGDGLSVSIAAASIVAKVTRDGLMRDYDALWSGYGFASHVGYGTLAHRAAIERLGPSPLHRRSFRGVLMQPPLVPISITAGHDETRPNRQPVAPPANS
jgi:ribonuclease HII